MMASLVLTAAIVITGVPADGISQTEQFGFRTSEYQGKWYHKKWEKTRKCIMDRESNHNYKAANRSSSARGAYQFLDSQWRHSLVWMMLKEGGNKTEIKALRDKPIHKWSRYYQDRAFFTAWRHGEGRHHWYYPGHACY